MQISEQRQFVASTEPQMSTEALLDIILKNLDDNKAEDVITIDLRGKTSMSDFMVVASGRSSRQVSAIAEHLLSRLKDAGQGNCPAEGLRQGDWVLIDAGDVIIHLFRPEVRAFYNLEKMWSMNLTGETPVN